MFFRFNFPPKDRNVMTHHACYRFFSGYKPRYI